MCVGLAAGLEAPHLAQISHDMTISSVVERWPDAARIFARYGLSCASCSISKSETIMAGAPRGGGGRGGGGELVGGPHNHPRRPQRPPHPPPADAPPRGAPPPHKGAGRQ